MDERCGEITDSSYYECYDSEIATMCKRATIEARSMMDNATTATSDQVARALQHASSAEVHE